MWKCAGLSVVCKAIADQVGQIRHAAVRGTDKSCRISDSGEIVLCESGMSP
jgi:hypothetical protein